MTKYAIRYSNSRRSRAALNDIKQTRIYVLTKKQKWKRDVIELENKNRGDGDQNDKIKSDPIIQSYQHQNRLYKTNRRRREFHEHHAKLKTTCIYLSSFLSVWTKIPLNHLRVNDFSSHLRRKYSFNFGTIFYPVQKCRVAGAVSRS